MRPFRNISTERGDSKASPIIFPACHLERVSRPPEGKGWPRWSHWFPRVQEMEMGVPEAEALWGHQARCWSRESCTEEPWRAEEDGSSSAEYQTKHGSKETTQNQRTILREQRNLSGVHSDVEIVCVSTSKSRKKPYSSRNAWEDT